MHGQTEPIIGQAPPSAGFADPPGRRADAAVSARGSLAQIPGLALYLATLVLELPGIFPRGLLAYLGAATLGELLAPGLSAETLAWVAAFAPLAWSVFAFAVPGHGWLWRRRSGARRPSEAEWGVLNDVLSLIGGGSASRLQLSTIYVLDDPLPSAAVRGRTLMLSRGLLESEALPAVLAHELGHLNSLDGVLSEALNRLCVWPVASAHSTPGMRSEHQLAEEVGQASGGWARRLIASALRLGAGGIGQRALSPLWAAYWRSREYAADARAADLGQAEDLARYLAEEEMPFDVPVPYLIANSAPHPPTALRVERLLGEAS